VARGAAGGAGLRAGGAARDWDEGAGDERAGGEGAGDEGAARDGARTGMAGEARPTADWPFPGYPPVGPGALDLGLGVPPLGWLGVPGCPVRDWDGTSGPFVPARAQPDGGRAAGSSVREGRSSGGGVRPGAPFVPILARPIATAPAPGLAVESGAFGPACAASVSATAPGVPGAAAAAPARAPAAPAVAPAVATWAATPAAWAGLRRAQRAAR